MLSMVGNPLMHPADRIINNITKKMLHTKALNKNKWQNITSLKNMRTIAKNGLI